MNTAYYDIVISKRETGEPVKTLTILATGPVAREKARDIELEWPGCFGQANWAGHATKRVIPTPPARPISEACVLVDTTTTTLEREFPNRMAAQKFIGAMIEQAYAIGVKVSDSHLGDTITLTFTLPSGKTITRTWRIEPA